MDSDALTAMLADLLAATRAFNGVWPQPGKWGLIQERYPSVNIHGIDKHFLGALLCLLGYAEDIKDHFDWEESTRMLFREDSNTKKKFAVLKERFFQQHSKTTVGNWLFQGDFLLFL